MQYLELQWVVSKTYCWWQLVASMNGSLEGSRVGEQGSRFCHRKIGPYRNLSRCKEILKQAGNWEEVNWGGSTAIYHKKNISGDQKWKKNSTESKRPRKVHLKVSTEGKEQAEPVIQFYSVGTQKGEQTYFNILKTNLLVAEWISSTKNKH